MVRHGYTHCATCHVSNNGGGILTPYGRELSREILSSWGREGEQRYLHGLVSEEQQEELNEKLLLGADVRLLQYYRDTPTVQEARFIPMQTDLEAAALIGPTKLVGTLGFLKEGKQTKLGSRRYYFLYQFNENTNARIGRFFPAYGLNIPDHVAYIRRDLGFDQGQEKDSVELYWQNEIWSASLTPWKSPGEVSPSLRESGFTVLVQKALGEKATLAANALWAQGEDLTRTLLGLNSIIGFSHEWYLLLEADWQHRDDKAQNLITDGGFFFGRLGYEFNQGMHLVLTEEVGHTDLQKASAVKDATSFGFLFYPRPHFELQFLVQKSRNRSSHDGYDDVGWFQFHYYL